MRNKVPLIISGIVIAIILALYVVVFTSNVTKLEGNTLTQKIEGNKAIYHSNITVSKSDIKVIVNTYSDDEIGVEFDLPNNKFSYMVNLKKKLIINIMFKS